MPRIYRDPGDAISLRAVRTSVDGGLNALADFARERLQGEDALAAWHHAGVRVSFGPDPLRNRFQDRRTVGKAAGRIAAGLEIEHRDRL